MAIDPETLAMLRTVRVEQSKVAIACGMSLRAEVFVFSAEAGGAVPPYPDAGVVPSPGYGRWPASPHTSTFDWPFPHNRRRYPVIRRQEFYPLFIDKTAVLAVRVARNHPLPPTRAHSCPEQVARRSRTGTRFLCSGALNLT